MSNNLKINKFNPTKYRRLNFLSNKTISIYLLGLMKFDHTNFQTKFFDKIYSLYDL